MPLRQPVRCEAMPQGAARTVRAGGIALEGGLDGLLQAAFAEVALHGRTDLGRKEEARIRAMLLIIRTQRGIQRPRLAVRRKSRLGSQTLRV